MDCKNHHKLLNKLNRIYLLTPKIFLHRPKVRRDKKDERKASSWNSTGQKEPVKPKAIKRIDTGMVKLKLLDATRKAIMEKSKRERTLVSS